MLIAAFTGWNDAGDAASNAVRHLVEAWSAKPLAEIDPEEFTDFATVRPHVRLRPDRSRHIVWPTVGLWYASTPGGDVILLLGPEPALRWRLFTEHITAIAARFDVSMVLTLGALLADVPHTRPVQIIGTAADQRIIDRFELQRSRYEGPTGIVGVLHDACNQADISSASLWAAVPAYASQIPSPKASLALITRACDMLGSPAPLGGMRREADEYEQRVASLVADDADLVGYVERLESMADNGELDDDYDDDESFDDDLDLDDLDDHDTDDLDDDDVAPTPSLAADNADELMAELEQFLRDQGNEA